MRHDPEKAICEVIAAALVDTLDNAVQLAAPVVTFFDPSSVEDENRIVVICDSGETATGDGGSGTVSVSIIVKSLLKDPSLSDDIELHFERVNAVRGCFTAGTLVSDLDSYAVDGFSVDHISRGPRRFGTNMDRESGMVNSFLELEASWHATA